MFDPELNARRDGMMFNVSILYLVVPLAAGVIFGYVLREKKRIDLDRLMVGVIVVLIFSLGFSIGSNNMLLKSLPRVGLGSLGIAFSSMVFSVILVALVRRRVRIE
jgi:hypothetical protein